MNIVKCISGKSQEGKTTELLEDYLRVNKKGSGINAVFISCEQSVGGVFLQLTKVQERIVELDSLDSDKDITFDRYKLVACDTADSLYSVINSHILQYDCNLYIDMPEVLDNTFNLKVQELVDKNPSGECLNSVDITWTRSRRIA